MTVGDEQILAMSNSNDKDRTTKPAGGSAPPDESPGGGKRSGRVAFDARNNPIWEWQLETGVYSRDVSTQKLKKLDLGDLSIAESAIQKRPAGLEDSGTEKGKPARPLPGGGFNPYDSSARPTGHDPYDKARLLSNQVKAEAARPAVRPVAPRKPAMPVAPPKQESALDKLGRWFKGKKKSDDDDYE